jgi:hypothetical protein
MARWAVRTMIGFLKLKSQQCLVGLPQLSHLNADLERQREKVLEIKSKELIANEVKLKA